MPSRADTRVAVEWLLRVALIALLGWALWRTTRSSAASPDAVAVDARNVDAEIARLVAAPAPASIDVSMDQGLSRSQRDALVALRRAGSAVRWHGTSPALAIEAVREREPDARGRLLIAAGDSSSIALADSAGALDTVRAGGGATVDVGTLVGSVRAALGRHSATTLAPPATPRGAVMVLSHVGWESKFVMAALTEAGWTVRARIPAAPSVDVRDDGLLPLDTARYDAVIALDSSAADFGGAIAHFVAQGGGLVVVGDAMSIDALRSLVPAQAGARRVGRILLAEDTVTPPDLPVRPLSELQRDALTLEKEPSGVTLVARRAGMGRVLAVGYDDTWRWRMLGGNSGLSAHRAWWSRAVGSVAPEREGAPMAQDGDAAPRAALADALGAPSTSSVAATRAAIDALPLALFTMIALALLAEIASRRFRGAR